MNKSKWVAVRHTLSLALVTAFAAMAMPRTADAQFLAASDCSFGFKNVYQDNEPVCALVQAGGSVLGGPGIVCVIPPGGQPSDDVTPGGCNAVGIFLEEPFLWLPPTTPGNYTILLVNNQGFTATDNITINSSGGAAPTVDVAAIKAAATASAGPWRTLADWGEYIDEFASAISVAWAIGTGDWLSAAVGVAGIITGQPTDYNGAVLDIGGQIISALAGTQAARYETLAADPPDPAFTELFALDLGAINADLAALAPVKPGVPLEYPFSNLNDDPMHLASTALANSMAEEAALVFTLMRTLEKYQGAEMAADDQYTLLQAQGLVKYADMLTGQLANTRQKSLDYKAGLTANGIADVVYNGADVSALFSRLTSSGLTADEEQSLRDAGFTDADIQLLFDRINFFGAPTGSFSRGAALDDIVAATDGMMAAVADLRNQAQDVVDHFEPLVSVQHPTADAGGPYNVDEGALANFNGSGSSDPQAQPLTYEWDFDLDGQFDDASGPMVSNTYNTPVVTQVGLKVTDTEGNSDIAYATVVVAEVNAAPTIDSFAPASLSPTASNLSPLDFLASASDPDMDPVTYLWTLDGAFASSAPGWTYTPNMGDTGTRAVKLVVSDGNPLSQDAIETRVVLLLDEVLVPDVVGLPQADAEAAILGANLVVGAVTAANDPVVPAGDVISQDPSGGAVALAGSAVDIEVSLGPADVVVPDVVGLPQGAAEAAIVGANLVVGAVTTANDPVVPAGDVIDQNPPGGASVSPGSAVDILVSLGPADVVVPDVVGLPLGAAEATIVGANLVVGAVNTANDPVVPDGDVIDQFPPGGAIVPPGSPVDLLVSLGPADTVVPDVVGLPQGAAEAAIVGANLVVGAVDTQNDPVVPAGDVISQNPPGGASVPPGSAVDIVVSDGPAGTPPDRPENLVGRAKLTSVNLGWQGSDTATGYQVFRRLATEGSFSMLGQTGASAFLDSLPAGTASADYYVVAVNGFGASDPSDTVTVAPGSRR